MTDMVAPAPALRKGAAKWRVGVIGCEMSPAYYAGIARRDANRKTGVHYVYALIDPRDERVRYIGCSINPFKRRIAHGACCDLRDVFAWVRELKALGLIPHLAILDSGIGYPATKKIEDRYIDEYDQFHGGLLNRHCPLVWKRKKAEAATILPSHAEATA